MDVITAPAWMLCVNGWGRGGRHYGSGMDALRETDGVVCTGVLGM